MAADPMIVFVVFPALNQAALVQAATHDQLDDRVRDLIRRVGAAATVRAIPAAARLAAPFDTVLPLDMLERVIAEAQADSNP